MLVVIVPSCCLFGVLWNQCWGLLFFADFARKGNSLMCRISDVYSVNSCGCVK